MWSLCLCLCVCVRACASASVFKCVRGAGELMVASLFDRIFLDGFQGWPDGLGCSTTIPPFIFHGGTILPY